MNSQVTFTIVSDLSIRPLSQRLLAKFFLPGQICRPVSRLRLGCSVWRLSLRGGLALTCVLHLFSVVVRLVRYLG